MFAYNKIMTTNFSFSLFHLPMIQAISSFFSSEATARNGSQV